MNSRASKTTFLCCFVLALSLSFASALFAQGEPFYKGKTIRIITGFGAGDVDDQWPRLIGPIMAKYIPGNPGVIVQNMAGAGSMVAANYVYGVAKPDGLTLGWISPGLYIDQLMGKKEVQFDWTKFSWIGSPVQSNSQMYMRTDAPYINRCISISTSRQLWQHTGCQEAERRRGQDQSTSESIAESRTERL